MASNSFFSGRIPPELHQNVKDYCKESGKSKTQVLIEALSKYLNVPIQDRNDKNDEVTKEMYNLLIKRIEKIEKYLDENIVIITDNNDIDNNDKIKIDEKFKIIFKENMDELLTHEEEDTHKKYEDSNDDKDNNEKNISYLINQKLQTYENIDSKTLSEITDLNTSERKNLKNQALNKAKKQGYKTIENFKFNQPIKMTFRRGIKINGNEYILLCEGIEAHEKPIWSLIPEDNISYQPNILQNTD